MSALAANRDTKTRGLTLWDIEEAAAVDILYGGAAACINAAGYIAPVTDTSGDVFCGVVQEKCDNSGGSAGDLKAKVQMPMMALWAASGLAQSDVGGDCWFEDDQTITTTPGNCYAGKIYALYSTTGAWVNHLPAARTCDSWALADDAAAVFGTGSDVSLKFDATNLELLPASDDLCAFNIGDGTTDMDFKWFGGTTAKYVVFDVGDVLLKLEDVDLHLGDNDAIEFGDAAAGDVRILWNATNLAILPKTDDTGAILVGDGTTDMDLKVFLSASTKYVEFNVGDILLNLEDVDLHLGDNDAIEFGDAAAGDVRILWNATNLAILPKTDDTGAILIGDGTTDMDLKWFGGTTGKYVEFNVGDVLLKLEDVDLKLGDDDILQFGDASGGDVSIKWNATNLVILPAADNTGQILIGDGTTDIDLKVFMNTSGKFVLFDVSEAILQLDDVDILLGDNDVLKFGDGSDVTITWNGAQLIVTGLPTSDPTVANALYTSSLALKLSAGA